MSFTIGSKVRDKVTGFEGIATARVEHLHGSTRFLVEQVVREPDPDPAPPTPPADPNAPVLAVGRLFAVGELHEYWFDEGRLETA